MKNIILKLISGIVVTAIAATTFSMMGCTPAAPDTAYIPHDSTVVRAGENNGIALKTVKLASDEFAAYDVSPLAESAYTITATVTDGNGSASENIQQVEYSLAWSDEEKTEAVTDYVTLTADGVTATLACLQPFDTQIIVTATSTLNPHAKGTVTVDFRQRIESVNINWGGTDYVVKDGDVVDVTFHALSEWNGGGLAQMRGLDVNAVNWSVGTVTPELNNIALSISLDEQFINSYRALYSDMDTQFTAYEVAAVADSQVYSEVMICNGMGVTTELANNFLEALTKTTKQIHVTLSYVKKQGENQTISFTLNASVPDYVSVAALSLDKTSVIFDEVTVNE